MLGADGELVLNLQRAKVRTVVDTYDRVRAQRLGDVVVIRCSRGPEDFEHHRPAHQGLHRGAHLVPDAHVDAAIEHVESRMSPSLRDSYGRAGRVPPVLSGARSNRGSPGATTAAGDRSRDPRRDEACRHSDADTDSRCSGVPIRAASRVHASRSTPRCSPSGPLDQHTDVVSTHRQRPSTPIDFAG